MLPNPLNAKQNEKLAKAAYVKARVSYTVGHYNDAKMECEEADRYSQNGLHDNDELENLIKKLSKDIEKDTKANNYYEEALQAKKAGDIETARKKVAEASSVHPSNEYLRKKIENLRRQIGEAPKQKNRSSIKFVYAAGGLFVLALLAAFAVKNILPGIPSPLTTTTVPATATAVAVALESTAPPEPGITEPATPQETHTPTPTPTPSLTPTPTSTPSLLPTPSLSPAPSPVLIRKGVVTEDRVRLRAGAGTNYSIVHQEAFFDSGAEMDVLDGPKREVSFMAHPPNQTNAKCTSRLWYNVQSSGSDLKGWICADYLDVEGEAAVPNR